MPNLEKNAPADSVSYFPVPVKPTVCGLPAALSAMLISAVRVPVAAGVNFTVKVQLLAAASGAPQWLVRPNSLALAPPTCMESRVKVPVPVFVSVTVCPALVVPTFCAANVRLAGESGTAGAVPVPVRLTVCGLPAALSVMSRALCHHRSKWRR